MNKRMRRAWAILTISMLAFAVTSMDAFAGVSWWRSAPMSTVRVESIEPQVSPWYFTAIRYFAVVFR